ncbi:MAG: helix-turn-helix transcriptional regulator [Sulfuricurvum sp.]|nr:helix-turn-helix transcriptional regulator [Sulfuricurvum sp.]
MESIEFSNQELSELHRLIGKNVADIRKEKGITQLDLALSIGYLSTSVIAKAEAGTEGRHFSTEQLYKISEALQVNMAVFFNDVNKRNIIGN